MTAPRRHVSFTILRDMKWRHTRAKRTLHLTFVIGKVQSAATYIFAFITPFKGSVQQYPSTASLQQNVVTRVSTVPLELNISRSMAMNLCPTMSKKWGVPHSVHPTPMPLITSSLLDNSFEELSTLFINIPQTTSDKKCNEIIRMLCVHADFCTETLHADRSVVKMRNYMDQHFSRKFDEKRFKKRAITVSGGLKLDMYVKYPVEVLRTQVEKTPRTRFIKCAAETAVYSPM